MRELFIAIAAGYPSVSVYHDNEDLLVTLGKAAVALGAQQVEIHGPGDYFRDLRSDGT